MYNITKEDIEALREGNNFKDVENSEDFYFQKAQDLLKEWRDLSLNEDIKNILRTQRNDYKLIQQTAESNEEIVRVLNLLFSITSYCDYRAKDKNKLNEYPNKRVLARAMVRMDDWINQAILFKFEQDQLPTGSVKNAFEYLLNPKINCTILSVNHRKMVAKNLLGVEYTEENFIDDLINYFEQFNIKTKNPDNYTHLLTRIVYGFEEKWLDDVVALMASDGTGWQEDHIKGLHNSDACIIWNSKKPSKGAKVLNFLNNKIKEEGGFDLFYSSGGKARYRATVIDFVTNEQDFNKRSWHNQFKNIYGYIDDYAQFVDHNKKAQIVFLCNDFEKIKPIDIDKFVFFGGTQQPRQDNLSPVQSLPEIEIMELKDTEVDKNNSNYSGNSPLNQILYGPPGTGKTYNTINKAIAICNPQFDLNQSRDIIKKEFYRLQNTGKIVFTTFHQSLSYEDFIEGLKPEEKNGSVVYSIKDGLFKRISNTALYACLKKDSSNEVDRHERFDLIYNKFLTHLEEQIENAEGEFFLPHKSRGYSLQVLSIEGSDIRTKGKTAMNEAKVEKEKLRMLYNKFPNITDIKNVVQDIRGVGPGLGWSSNYYGIFQAFKKFEETVYIEAEDLESQKHNYNYEEVSALVESISLSSFEDLDANDNMEKFVLIIDEINRGNVAQIFGELITLLEEDKRTGKPEALAALLPYSKKKFSVPPNLYIIGTMNTADRSVEALDVALRRRFSFDYKGPKYKLQELAYQIGNTGKSAKDLLKLINDRITYLKDEDHQIGHYYLMDKANPELLRETFEKNIIPLLKEYFYNDYGKIRLVLGDGFMKKDDFPKFPVKDPDLIEQENRYSLKPIDESFNILDALSQTLEEH
ncbi:MAG: McrB family protein [Candidatus Cyclobacteriaceae bacterium M2_1C_046]